MLRPTLPLFLTAVLGACASARSTPAPPTDAELTAAVCLADEVADQAEQHLYAMRRQRASAAQREAQARTAAEASTRQLSAALQNSMKAQRAARKAPPERRAAMQRAARSASRRANVLTQFQVTSEQASQAAAEGARLVAEDTDQARRFATMARARGMALALEAEAVNLPEAPEELRARAGDASDEARAIAEESLELAALYYERLLAAEERALACP